MNPTSSSLPSPPSEMESKFYYAGLACPLVLVARSSITPWRAPTGPGPEAYPRRKVFLVGSHAIKDAWEDDLDLKVQNLLDSMNIKCTRIDITRIGYDGESWTSAPVILSIEVIPASLSAGDGVLVAHRCRDILVEYHITDVDVEIYEPVVT